MYFISNKFLRMRGGSISSCTNAIYFALVQELIGHPSYIKKQLLEHDAYISCLQLKKVNVAHDAMHNNYLYNHTAYYHVLQQVIAFLVHVNTNSGVPPGANLGSNFKGDVSYFMLFGVGVLCHILYSIVSYYL